LSTPSEQADPEDGDSGSGRLPVCIHVAGMLAQRPSKYVRKEAAILVDNTRSVFSSFVSSPARVQFIDPRIR
jgi:ribosomal protein S12